jgi:hypothetical protein
MRAIEPDSSGAHSIVPPGRSTRSPEVEGARPPSRDGCREMRQALLFTAARIVVARCSNVRQRSW